MPNIPQYTNPVTTIRPTDMGSSAYELEGRHIGADIDIAGRYVGGGVSAIGHEIEQQGTLQETMAAQKATTAFSDEADKNLTDYFSQVDVNNPNAAQEWTEKYLQPGLEKIQDQFAGSSKAVQQHVLELTTHLQNQYTHEAHAQQLNLADAAAIQGSKDLENTLATKNYNNGGATYADDLKYADMALTAQAAHIPDPAKRATFLEQRRDQVRFKVTQSALEGMAQQPNGGATAALSAVSSGKFDMGLGDHKDEVVRSLTAIQTIQERQQAQAQHQANEKSIGALDKQLFSGPNNSFVLHNDNDYIKMLGDIANDPTTDAEGKRQATTTVMGLYRDVVSGPQAQARAETSANRAEIRFNEEQAKQAAAADGQAMQRVVDEIYGGTITTVGQIHTMAELGIIPYSKIGALNAELTRKNGGDNEKELRNAGYAAASVPFGGKTSPVWQQNYPALLANDQKLTDKGIPASERYDPKSVNYFAKGFQPELPKPTNPSASPATAVPPKKHLPAPGEVVKGYRYTGPPDGNRGDEKLWQKVQ